MKQEEKFVFDWRERQMSLACLAFLLVVGTMMAASLILLGFRDRKLAPGGGVLLGVLALLDLYAFDRFRKARITYEWTPAAVRLHGKWLEREIAFRGGGCVSGVQGYYSDEAAAAQPVPLLAEGILPGVLEAGGADRGPRDPSDFSPCPKRGRAAAGHAGAAGKIAGGPGAGRAGISAGLYGPGGVINGKNGESGAGSGPDFLNIAVGRGAAVEAGPCPAVFYARW